MYETIVLSSDFVALGCMLAGVEQIFSVRD